MNLRYFWIKNAITTGILLLLCFCLPAQEHSKQHNCGQDHPSFKALMKEHTAASKPSAQRNAMVCKKVRAYWIVPSDRVSNEERRKYTDISLREWQQQWSSQGRTLFVENLQTINTPYTMAQIQAGNTTEEG